MFKFMQIPVSKAVLAKESEESKLKILMLHAEHSHFPVLSCRRTNSSRLEEFVFQDTIKLCRDSVVPATKKPAANEHSRNGSELRA